MQKRSLQKNPEKNSKNKKKLEEYIPEKFLIMNTCTKKISITQGIYDCQLQLSSFLSDFGFSWYRLCFVEGISH